MPRDYKHRARRKKKRARLSPWTGVIGGLLIGLFVAFLVYIKMQAKPDPHVYLQESIPAPTATTRQEKPDVSREELTPATPKPRFDFYTLLPEMEVVVPEQETTANRQQTAPPPPTAPVVTAAPVMTTRPQQPAAPVVTTTAKPQAGTYYLQVGSFKNGAQAERFKAELAMQGMQTSIQKVTINKGTYHRVRVGPFRDFSTLDKTRQTLKRNGIDSTPIKVTG